MKSNRNGELEAAEQNTAFHLREKKNAWENSVYKKDGRGD